MTSAEPISPRDRRADEAVAALSLRGDHQAVVRLVETWASVGTPTPAARLAEARAFFHLRLMDRALARAREASDAMPDDPVALRLLAEIFIERGWPTRARKPLEALRARGEEGLDTLWARAHADPPRPETNARELERSGNVAVLLALAETFLATGSTLRATGILERLRRQSPDQPRAKELLWGIAGDFSSTQSFDALLDSLAPPAAFHPLAALPIAEEPEHTENFRVGATPPEPEEESEEIERAFPSLFKGSSATPFDDDPGEVTQASRLLAGTPEAPTVESTDPGYGGEERSGDTQILLVLKPGEQGDGRSMHTRAAGDLPQVVNLRDWREQMGVANTDTSQLEEEDENVVLTGRDDPAPRAETLLPFTGPIQVIEKHGIPDPESFADEQPTTIARPPTQPPQPAPVARPRRKQEPDTTWVWLAAAFVVVVIFVLAAVAFARVRAHAVSAAARTGSIELREPGPV